MSWYVPFLEYFCSGRILPFQKYDYCRNQPSDALEAYTRALDLQGLSKHLPLDLIDRVNALRRVERYISFSEIVDFSIEDAVYDAYSMEKELMYI